MILIKNARIDGVLSSVTVENGKILAVTEGEAAVAADRVIDARGAHLYAGLIDVHTHGMQGMDTMDGDNLPALAAAYLAAGTTTVFPTTVTAAGDRLRELLSQDISFKGGANILGFHVEGPYVNPRAAGAQDPAYIKNPDPAEFSTFKNVSILTLAPELEGAMELIKSTQASVALGHTVCDEATALAAFRAGAKQLSHTCNAMPPLSHRAPGPIGAAIEADAYAQVISDGLHIHKNMVLALYRIFGARRMILISDSMRATGMPDGQYMLGGLDITVRDGVARTEDGALAGSTTTLLGCVKKAISFGIPAADAFRMASRTPAEMLGLNKGVITPGYDAEFILVDDGYNLIEAFNFT